MESSYTKYVEGSLGSRRSVITRVLKTISKYEGDGARLGDIRRELKLDKPKIMFALSALKGAGAIQQGYSFVFGDGGNAGSTKAISMSYITSKGSQLLQTYGRN